MKIALIRRRGSAIGGAELYADRLMRALVGRGHEVHLLAEAWEGLAAGVHLHTLSVAGSRSVRPKNFAVAAKIVTAVERFDCVFSLERTLSQDVYRAGDGVHRVWLERRRQFAPWWKRPFVGLGRFHRTLCELEKRTFDPAITRRVIVNSDMVRREIIRCFGYPEDRIHLVRNGIDVARFQRGERAATRARLGLDPDEFTLLFVGSGWERKGLPTVLEMMRARHRRKDRVRLLVVGKGRSGAVPPNVSLLGTMKDVEHAYAAADLFVFPPIYEPSANVVFEALASGLPVVTTVFDGAAEVLTEGVDGTVLADPTDAVALGQAVDYWRAHPGRVHFDSAQLELGRNLDETVRVLELAAAETRQ